MGDPYLSVASMEGEVYSASNMNELKFKKESVTQRLDRREEERLAELQKRKDEKDSQTASNESVDFFTETFYSAEKRIQSGLSSADNMDKIKLTEHFDSIVTDIQKLQKFLSDSTLFLPSYEVQRSQAVISKLQMAIQEKRDSMMPKKKFAFKSKTKTTEAVNHGDLQQSHEAEKKPSKVAELKYSYADVSNENLTMFGEDVVNKDIAMARLSKCVVKIIGTPSAVLLNGLTDCKVFCGPVTGSIFIDGCKDCVFVMACQQLRVHHTSQTNFYLHVTSRAIIEDCTSLCFAPYNWQYPELDEHYNASQLDRSRNTWNDVDDFNWLASDTPSPNWCVLSEDERVQSWDV